MRFLAGSVSKSSRELSQTIIMFGPQFLLQRERTAVSELRLVSLAPKDTVVVGRRIGGTSFPLFPLPGEAPGRWLSPCHACLQALWGAGHTRRAWVRSACVLALPLLVMCLLPGLTQPPFLVHVAHSPSRLRAHTAQKEETGQQHMFPDLWPGPTGPSLHQCHCL